MDLSDLIVGQETNLYFNTLATALASGYLLTNCLSLFPHDSCANFPEVFGIGLVEFCHPCLLFLWLLEPGIKVVFSYHWEWHGISMLVLLPGCPSSIVVM